MQALILLRNRGVLDPTELLSLFFGLFHCQVFVYSFHNPQVGMREEGWLVPYAHRWCSVLESLLCLEVNMFVGADPFVPRKLFLVYVAQDSGRA